MRFDTSRFPLVFLMENTQAAGPTETVEAQLIALLDRGERFVLLTDHLPGDHAEESHEERKERALFFKRNKDRMKRLCGGLVFITGDRSVSAAVRLAAQGAGKVLGLGFAFVPSEDEATGEALRLLAKGSPSTTASSN
ncbi:hypothetical protein ACQ86G_22185 [Roseateles chitinivorans]|uniref:hypothetical protein n=1 Tax=Roseateles chitinivorans TaxID=2917965 RepID=UPI003D678A73